MSPNFGNGIELAFNFAAGADEVVTNVAILIDGSKFVAEEGNLCILSKSMLVIPNQEMLTLASFRSDMKNKNINELISFSSWLVLKYTVMLL